MQTLSPVVKLARWARFPSSQIRVSLSSVIAAGSVSQFGKADCSWATGSPLAINIELDQQARCKTDKDFLRNKSLPSIAQYLAIAGLFDAQHHAFQISTSDSMLPCDLNVVSHTVSNGAWRVNAANDVHAQHSENCQDCSLTGQAHSCMIIRLCSNDMLHETASTTPARHISLDTLLLSPLATLPIPSTTAIKAPIQLLQRFLPHNPLTTG